MDNTNAKISLKDTLPVIFMLLYFGSVFPGVWTVVLMHRTSGIVSMLLLFIWALIAIKPTNKFKFTNPLFTFFILISLLYLSIKVLFGGETYGVLVSTISCYISILLVLNSIGSVKFMRIITTIVMIMIIMAIIGVALAYAGILSPITDPIPSYADGEFINNYLLFTRKTTKYFDHLVIRTGGFFDEPGSLAFIILLVLCYNKLNSNSAIIEFVCIFGGLITLSAAHFITSAIYLMLFYVRKVKHVIFLALIAVGFIWFYNYEPDDPTLIELKYQVFNRMENIAEGTDESRNAEESKKVFEQYFPYGEKKSEIIRSHPDAVQETIWFFLGEHGLVGGFILLIPIIYICLHSLYFKGINSNEFKLVALLLLTISQRPFVYYPLYLTIIYFTWFDKKGKLNNIYDTSV